MQKTIYGIGVMSGTSLDGVDVVYVKFKNTETYDYEIVHCKTFAYSKLWVTSLKAAFDKKPEELKDLDISLGVYFGEVINEFIDLYEIPHVDIVASHGHTIFHKPEEGFTLQIGSGDEIAKVTGCKVVYDFRTQDVQLGGQGAPLVPIGDVYLFSKYDFCLNLGGFANVSFDQNGIRKAFDICPVNIVMNYYMNSIGQEYDDKGSLASTGKINEALLDQLNNDPFYALDHPKSLGFEFVHNEVIPLLDRFQLPLQDLLRTFVEHIAMQLTAVIKGRNESQILVTGGGAYNEFLINRLRALTNYDWIIPTRELVEYKEALIFTLLGVLRIQGKVNCLKSVTGAKKDHSSGQVSG